MDITVRAYTAADVAQMNEIWNEVVEDGVAFPQEDYLDAQTGAAFYAEQTYSAVAEGSDGKIYGLYILHPHPCPPKNAGSSVHPTLDVRRAHPRSAAPSRGWSETAL